MVLSRTRTTSTASNFGFPLYFIGILLISSIFTQTRKFQTNQNYDVNSEITYKMADSDLESFASTLLAQTVYGCKKLDSTGKCLYCVRDYVLINSVCVVLTYSQLIPNCNTYLNVTTCFQCDAGYYLIQGSCLIGNKALNCLAFLNSTACASCLDGSYLSNGVCIAIPNCLIVSGTSCTTCVNGYYPSSNSLTCIQSSTNVANCASYSGNAVCSRCQIGYTLSGDRLTCWDSTQVSGQVDPNCYNQVANEGNVCMVCREGYYLSGNQCLAFDLSESCFIANPDDKTKCWVCYSGYTMSAANGACSKNPSQVSAQVNPVGGSQNVFKIFMTIAFVGFAFL